MAKNSNIKQKGFSFYWLLGKIGDILFIPIILISLFSSVSMLVQRQQNKPTSFFGVSLVNILSKSMTNAGFLKGDTVITLKTDVNNIDLGDIIAFYNYRDSLDSATEKKYIIKYNYNEGDLEVDTSEENILGDVENKNKIISELKNQERDGEKKVEDAQKAKSSIYFHMVIGIYKDDYGNVFYKTKGTNNSNSDGYIRSDFVVGEYANTPRFLRDAMSFCASTRGMIILVCLPLSILVLCQCFSLIKQIEIMNLEKQLINGKKRFYDEEVTKVFNGNEMETHNKVYLYYTTSPDEREKLINFMWGNLLEKEKLSKKDEKMLNTLENANNKLNNSNKAYWETWIDGTKGFTRRKIKKYYEENAILNVLNNTNSVSNTNSNKAVQSNNEKQKEVNKTISNVLNKNNNLVNNEKQEIKNSKDETTKIKETQIKTTAKKEITENSLANKNGVKSQTNAKVDELSNKQPLKNTSIKQKQSVGVKNTEQDTAKAKSKNIAPVPAIKKDTVTTSEGGNVSKAPSKASSTKKEIVQVDNKQETIKAPSKTPVVRKELSKVAPKIQPAIKKQDENTLKEKTNAAKTTTTKTPTAKTTTAKTSPTKKAQQTVDEIKSTSLKKNDEIVENAVKPIKRPVGRPKVNKTENNE